MMLSESRAKQLCFDTLNKYAHITTNRRFGVVAHWTFTVKDIAPRALGLCYTDCRRIEIDKSLFIGDDPSALIDVILHECAHALAGTEYSPRRRVMAHGKLWKQWARVLGCKPTRNQPTGNFTTEQKEQMWANNKYYIVYDDGCNITIHGGCSKKLNMEGRQLKTIPDSIDRLKLVPVAYWSKYKDNRDKLVEGMI